MRYAILMAAALVAGCGREAAPADNAAPPADAVAPTTSAAPTPESSPSASPSRDYVGHWTGVEGMVLDVAAGDAPGRYRLTMQYDLDHRQTADATAVGDTLTFTRDGRPLTLRPTDGKATGLKYLADKHDCLTVASGEGYCRD